MKEHEELEKVVRESYIRHGRQLATRDLTELMTEDLIRAGYGKLSDEADEWTGLIIRQGQILTGVANAVNGDPGPLRSWSHHDLAEKAAKLAQEHRDAHRDALVNRQTAERYESAVEALSTTAQQWADKCPADDWPEGDMMDAAIADAGREILRILDEKLGGTN